MNTPPINSTDTESPAQDSNVVNVAMRMSDHARVAPDQVAIVETVGSRRPGKRAYRQIRFRELDERSNQIASGLRAFGVTPGTRLALLVPPGIEFVALVFGLLKSGAVAILIDPGMGRENLVRCLSEAEPEGFVAVPKAMAVRTALRRRFSKSRFNVTVGRRWFWGGPTLRQLCALGNAEPYPIDSRESDPAAIIFTTGSTGPPKGVLYRHGNFDGQVAEIRDQYGIEPGTVNLAAFPLFGLFNAGMGATTVFPNMDFTRPADVDPEAILSAIQDWNVTQAFASPALWKSVGRYCESTGKKMSSLKAIYSAGAPVPGRVIEMIRNQIDSEGEFHTPYGATEALPIATISGSEILNETQQLTDEGAGVCVGRHFPGIDWKIVRIVDGPIRQLDEAEELPPGEIGELLVTGPVVTREYVTRVEANLTSKVLDNDARLWHRMGDTGYLDEQGRFWFCGRVAHRVRSSSGDHYTIPSEAIVNTMPEVEQSALVGIGPPGNQDLVLIIEPPDPSTAADKSASDRLRGQVRQFLEGHPKLQGIDHVLIHPKLPVDIRHNAKIFRERLAIWAAEQLS